MPESKYRIITNGRPAKGQRPEEVLKRLAALFKAPPEKVRGLLAGKVMTVRKGIDEQAAMRMLSALKKAGLVCKAEPEGQAPSTTKPSPKEATAPDVRAAMEARAIDPDMGSIVIEHTVMASGEITPSGQGMDFHKPGARDIPYSEILLMAVYEPPSALGGQTKLMVFHSGSKRPAALNATSIKYWQFEGVTSKSAGVSLRQFIAHVYAHNPSVMLDTPTVKYLGGGLPRPLDVDESILASALGKALAAEGLFREPEGTAPSGVPDMGEMLRKIRQAASSEPEQAGRGRSLIALMAASLSTAWLVHALYGQIALLRLYGPLFKGSSNPFGNHLIMWSSLAIIVLLLFYSFVALKRIWGKNPKAPGSFRLLAWCLGIFSIVRFALLSGLAIGLRRGILSGGYALADLADVLRSKYIVRSALILSPALIAIPLLIISAMVFSHARKGKGRHTR